MVTDLTECYKQKHDWNKLRKESKENFVVKGRKMECQLTGKGGSRKLLVRCEK